MCVYTHIDTHTYIPISIPISASIYLLTIQTLKSGRLDIKFYSCHCFCFSMSLEVG